MVHPDDGGIWFTDPSYGSLRNYAGNKGEFHLKEAVYRIDAQSGQTEKVTDEIGKQCVVSSTSAKYNTN
ncbi:TPA: hypothetical protein EYN98_22125 [Candidatus Poribacteria bacterium]|nr:hypothetical protein [Candidatus Poribacteria bacterium]